MAKEKEPVNDVEQRGSTFSCPYRSGKECISISLCIFDVTVFVAGVFLPSTPTKHTASSRVRIETRERFGIIALQQIGLVLPITHAEGCTMVSDATVERYYYIFDSREHRALVVDRATGEEVAWGGIPRVQLIEYVSKNQAMPALRRFARWCARQTGADAALPETATAQLWAAAVEGGEEDRSVRRETTGAVVRAAALGLPRRHPEAARLLAAHACTHSDSRRAAIDAAHMSERWAEFEADVEPEAAVRAMRQRQVDWLLDALDPS